METPPTEGNGGPLQAVHRLTAALVAAPTVESIYDAALDVLIGSLKVDRAAIVLFDHDGVLRFKAWRGLSDAYRRVVEGHNPWAAPGGGGRTPEPIVLADVATDLSPGPIRDTILGEGIRSLAFVPLLYGARLLGKFIVYGDRPNQLGTEEVALARTVAGHVAFALEKRRLEDELRLVADQLGATLDAVSESITVQTPDGQLLLANQTAATMLGYPSVDALVQAGPAEVAGRFDVLDEHGQPLALERLPGRAALRGEEPDEMLVRWRRAGTGEERFSLVKATPVRNEAGGVRFAVNVFRDVTDHQLALEALRTSEARLAFVASASRRLLTTLEPSRVLDEVIALVVPELADWCVVRELARDGVVWTAVGPQHLENEDPLASLRRCHDDLVDHPVTGDLAAGRSLLITPEILDQLARGEELIDRVARNGIRSLVLVPLRARGRIVGVLTLAAGEGRSPYGESDLALAEDLAIRVAAAMDNARSYAHERSTAETLTRALLPGRLPDIPGLQVAARYRTAGDVGGDFYDCFPTSDGSWMFVVGDVCGRGIHAASMTGLTRHTIRAAALHGRTPAAVLSDLNRLLLDAAGEEMAAWLPRSHSTGPSFCTVCLAQVTPSEGGARVVISAAGHPLPLLVRCGAEVLEVGRPGSLLGVLADVVVAEEGCVLGPGDALVMFTDGITERRRDGRLFEEQMPSTLRGAAGAPAAELARHLEEAAVSFARELPVDDMAVLVISVPRLPVVADVRDDLLDRAEMSTLRPT